MGTDFTIKSISVSSDGWTLASGGADRSVRLWDISTGKQIRAGINYHTGTVNSGTYQSVSLHVHVSTHVYVGISHL